MLIYYVFDSYQFNQYITYKIQVEPFKRVYKVEGKEKIKSQ